MPVVVEFPTTVVLPNNPIDVLFIYVCVLLSDPITNIEPVVKLGPIFKVLPMALIFVVFNVDIVLVDDDEYSMIKLLVSSMVE